jgi:hypothetical protein
MIAPRHVKQDQTTTIFGESVRNKMVFPTDYDYLIWSKNQDLQDEKLQCGCLYNKRMDETIAVCEKHRPQARYVGGISEYVIGGKPDDN